jgi:hypothetical protein
MANEWIGGVLFRVHRRRYIRNRTAGSVRPVKQVSEIGNRLTANKLRGGLRNVK